jgi:hypothetical protein
VFIESSYEQFVNSIKENNIVYLSSIKGFEDEAFVNENSKVFQGINVGKMNILHWVIFTKRNDLFTFLFHQFFTNQSEGENMEKAHAKLIKQQHSSLISIQNCMVGSSEAFYDYDFLKQNKIKKDCNSYTQNIKFLEKKDGSN